MFKNYINHPTETEHQKIEKQKSVTCQKCSKATVTIIITRPRHKLIQYWILPEVHFEYATMHSFSAIEDVD